MIRRERTRALDFLCRSDVAPPLFSHDLDLERRDDQNATREIVSLDRTFDYSVEQIFVYA